MTDKRSILFLLISLSLFACNDSTVESSVEDSRKLNAVSAIADEIEKVYAMECDPFLRAEDGVAQIEFKVTDSDCESMAVKISELDSVQAFEGELQLLFRVQSGALGSNGVRESIRFDAKTGRRVTP